MSLIELTLDEHSTDWNNICRKDGRFAKELKITINLEVRSDARIRWAINGNDAKTGVAWHFEDLAGGGLTLNQLEVCKVARGSLDKIERMAIARGGGVISVNG